MKKYLLLFFSLSAASAFAQVPEDAIRYSWYPQNGTARTLAVGGVMGSLGGDITSTFVNPAGLGFYKTREFVLTPGIYMNNLRSNYRDNRNTEKKNTLGFGPIGYIEGRPNRIKAKQSTAYSFAITQTANFNNVIRYKGLNNFSSFTEQFAEEFSKSGYSIEEALNFSSPLPYTSALGLYTYLIDTVRSGSAVQVRGVTENILDAGQAVQQEMYKATSGGIYELALAAAHNSNDKWFVGGTLGVPIVNFKSYTEYKESDTSSNARNGFKSFTYTDNFKTTGVGANVKLGVIYRPQDYVRFGLAVHSPTLFMLADKRTASAASNLETPTGVAESFSATSTQFTNGEPGESKYNQFTPWRFILSGAYVFRELENVKKQRGFVSADVEYVGHGGSRFSSENEEPTADEKSYFKALNKVVKQQYKGAFNFKVGGELKFNVIMARLGFAYYMSPYEDAAFKANRMLLSGGLGYRHKGAFVDLTYVHNINKNADFPYRLEDRANTYATTKQALGNIVATVGWKF